MRRPLVMLCALSALLSAAAAAGAKAPPVAFAGCAGPAVRPADVVLACGDGNAAFTVARWSRWTHLSAHASGVAVINDCDPTCVAGHFHSQPAALVLDRPRPCHGRLRFSRLRLVFAHRPARGQPAPATYACR